MAEAVKAPHLTEPVPISCHFIEGAEIEIRDEFLRITGWIDLETAADDLAPERRIVMRAAMPLLVARMLILDLRRAVARGGN